MKATIKLALMGAIALGAATTMTSCNKGGNEPTRDEVKIFTSVAGMTRAPQLDETGEGVFSNDDVFGLVVKVNDGVGDDNSKRFDYTVGTTKLYWDQMPVPDEESNYAFMAVYPNVPEFNTDVMTPFDFNAATAENPDLLIARASVAKNDNVKLTFSHAMHKLNVKLTSNFFTTEQLNEAYVGVANLKSTVPVNPWGGGAVPQLASQTPGSYYSNKTGANMSWIVAPQELTPGFALVTIQIGEYLMTYRVPTDLTVLDGGEVTTLKLDLHRDAVSLEGKDVGQWGTENEVPGTIPVTE